MTEQENKDVATDLAELSAVTMGAKPAKRVKTSAKALYPIAFHLIESGKPFQYRSTKAVKVDKTHAVLIPSGKYVTIDKMKIVKVRS